MTDDVGPLSPKLVTILKLVGLVIGCIAKFVTGSLFVFNVYQEEIKTSFNLTQQEVELQSSLLNLGLGVGFLPGILYDRFGPKWTSTAGLVVSVGSYILLWSTTKTPSFYSRNSWLMGVYFFTCGLGSVFTYMVALNTNIINFKSKHHGLIVGILNACFSGSPSIFSLVYYKVLTGSQKFANFMMMFAVCFGVVDILCILLLRIYAPEADDETCIIISNEESDDKNYQQPSAVYYQSENLSSKVSFDSTQSNNEPIREYSPAAIKESLTIKQLLFSVDFHLFTWMFVCAASTGLVYVNNLTAIARSLHFDDYNVSLVQIIPITSTCVSILIGIVSDLLRDKVPRINILVGGCLILVVSQTIVLVFGNSYILLIFGTFFCGLGVATLWSLSPAVMIDTFGARNIGRNWGIVILLAALSGLLTQEIFGATYDARVDSGEIYCYGIKCLRGGVGVSLAAAFISVILGAIYIFRKRLHGPSAGYSSV